MNTLPQLSITGIITIYLVLRLVMISGFLDTYPARVEKKPELAQPAKFWLALGTTKTGAVYRLKGNPPNAHE